MNIYNNIKSKISEYDKNNEQLTDYLNSLVFKTEQYKDYTFPEEVLLEVVEKAKSLTKLDFKYEKELDSYSDLKNIITIKNSDFEKKYDITLLPKKLGKDRIYFISDNTNIKIQIIDDLICLGHFSNNQTDLGFVISENDKIEKVAFNRNHQSSDLIYKNMEVFLKLFNSYGISNLNDYSVDETCRVIFDMDLNLDKCPYYKSLRSFILNFTNSNDIKNKI